ncbi:hypothetical protein LINPERHAP2_LOCUS42480 [Linum perenne]
MSLYLSCYCILSSLTFHSLLCCRYRIQLYVSDATAETIFVLLGLSAERIMPLSAIELARAYPDDYGDLPPPISVVSRAWGLVMNRAQLIAQLPPPPRSPRLILPTFRVLLFPLTYYLTIYLCSFHRSPPRRHDTPLPPDPRYVPPVPTYDPSLKADPELLGAQINAHKVLLARSL